MVPKKYRKYLKFDPNNIEKLIEFDKCIIYKHFTDVNTIINANPECYLSEIINDLNRYTCLDVELNLYTIDVTIYKSLSYFLFKIQLKSQDEIYRSSYTYYIYSTNEYTLTAQHEYLPKLIEIIESLNARELTITISYAQKKHNTSEPSSLYYFFINNAIVNLQLQYSKVANLNDPYKITIVNNNLYETNFYINPNSLSNKYHMHTIKYNTNLNKPVEIKLYSPTDGILEIIKQYNSSTGKIINKYTNYYIKNCKYMTHKHHRYNGPAQIIMELDQNNQWIETKKWLINGVSIPDDIPKIEKGKPLIPLTKSDTLNSILFDRDYGTYIKRLYDEQENNFKKIP